MTNKIKYLLITCILMLFSSGAMAIPITGSITFTGGSGVSTLVTEGDGSFVGAPGAPVDILFFPDFGWDAYGYTFILDWGEDWNLALSGGSEGIFGTFVGHGDLSNASHSTFARLSAIFDISDEGYGFEVTTTAVPEPQTLALLGIALLAFGTIRLSRSRNRR